MTLKVFGVKFQ